MKFNRFVMAAGLLAIALLLLARVPAATDVVRVKAQAPQPPHRFSGSVTLDSQPAAIGTQVQALIGATVCGTTTVVTSGQYLLDVVHTTQTPGCGTDDPLALVYFRVAGLLADQIAIFTMGGVTDLDLTATGSSATQCNMAIAKTDSADPVAGGASLTYTIIIRNVGGSPCSSVSVTDNLPAGVTSVEAIGCTISDLTVTCNFGTVLASQVGVATITVNAPFAAGTLTNTASVATTSTEATLANNTASEMTTVQVPTGCDMTIAKTDSPDPVAREARLTYTITIQNTGDAPCSSVSVTDNLPAGVTSVEAIGCTISDLTVTCNFGTVASGIIGSATVTANAPSATGTITNAATVSTTSGEASVGNNTASETTTVVEELATENVLLVAGACNPAVMTYPAGTTPETVAFGTILPPPVADTLAAFWRYNPATAATDPFDAWSPTAPAAANDLIAVDAFLEVWDICIKPGVVNPIFQRPKVGP